MGKRKTATPKDILVRARELLTPKSNWIRNHAFGKKDGKSVRYCSRVAEAECFCSLGAIARASYELTGSDQYLNACIDAEQMVTRTPTVRKRSFSSIASFNDSIHTTHEIVLDAFDKAIKSA